MVDKMKQIDYLKESFKNNVDYEDFNEFLNDNSEEIILKSGLFDEEWYSRNYPDVKKNNLNLIWHYIYFGVEEGCKPNPLFDPRWYLDYYDDVKKANFEPFLHYILFGQYEGRFTNLTEYMDSLNKMVPNFQIDKIISALNKKISIIIPIYNAFEDTEMCINSVIENTEGIYELLLINDNSPDKRIKPLLDGFAKKYDNIRVIHNSENKGFVKNVNIGFKNTENDVILLNSDTKVTKKWLLKLTSLAYSRDDIATVTPVSNNSGAFSVPEIGVDNPIPDDLSIDLMGNIIEKSSKKIFMDAPTGNGFCMYIKREAINSVGLFDDVNFGKGYGEENDFCMRLLYDGWTNVIDDSTYIYHKSGASFSKKREELMKINRKILDSKHPTYTRDIRRFIASEELKSIQDNVRNSLNTYSKYKFDKKRILYVMHGGIGGTLNTNLDLMSVVEHDYDAYFLTSNGLEMKLYHYLNNELTELESWKLNSKWILEDFFNDEFKEVYYNLLMKYSIDMVHIRHLIHHSFDLPYLTKQLGIKTVLSFHDFYFICPSITLVNGDNVYCNGVCGENNNCRIPFEESTNVSNLNNFVVTWRNEINKLFENIDEFVTTSPIVKNLFLEIYPKLINKNFHIIEHGRDFNNVKKDMFEIPSLERPIKILFIGNINIEKGALIIKELAEFDKNSHLEIHFLGNTVHQLTNVGIHHGPYLRENLFEEIKKINPSFIGIFSIWPETYCHTLTEAWASGIPVLSTKIGVLEERMENTGGGWFIDHNSIKETYDLILQIASNESEYMSKQKMAKDIKFKSIQKMGDEYIGIYKDLLLD